MERVKFTMEFLFRASPTILYQFLTTPSCLIRWFCDSVDIQGNNYIFIWNDAAQIAEVLDDIEEERLRFRWQEADDKTEFLEFNISIAPVTDETILEITDFCDADEVDDQKQLWETQIEQLRHEIGG